MPVGCGDGVAGDDEECDDGNTSNGDGCSALCELEPGGDVCSGVASHPGVSLRAVVVARDLSLPVYVTAPPLDPRRLFIVEQRGRVKILAGGTVLPEPFLSIVDKVGCCNPERPSNLDERGLLGLAFHPDYERNGWFFVNYINNAGDTVIARYTVSADPNRADVDSERILFTIDQPRSNHNGGQLAFGPDGDLYIGMGDGGGAGDPEENAQDDSRILGKMLRVDVDVAEAPYYRVPPTNPKPQAAGLLALVWAKGLRNPWRFSFDRGSGDLYIGDVGQNRLEEIDVQPAGSAGGANYGWDIFEASSCYEPEPPSSTCPDPANDFVFPVYEYGRGQGVSVTGGYVYRGCALPDLRGMYLYGDFGSAFIRSFELVGGAAENHRDWTATLAPGGGLRIDSVASFGEDARGEIYIVDRNGEVFQIVAAEE
jgi:cysteine-rich repeat protein